MSDFFTRLAERTLGLAFIIQPIKPSLFAPPPDSIGEMLLESTEEYAGTQTLSGPQERFAQTSSAEVQAVQSERSQAGPPFMTTTSDQANGEVDQLDSQAEPTTTPIQQSTGHISNDSRRGSPAMVSRRGAPLWSPAMVPLQPLPVTLLQSSPATPLRPSSTSVVDKAPREGTSPHAYDQTQARVETIPRLNDPVRREQNSEVSDVDNLSVRKNISDTHLGTTEVLETSTIEHEQRLARHISLENGRGGDGTYPRSSRRVRPSAQIQPEATASEPTIQVTIGRVEVRAVTAPSTTTRAQQQPAKPSAMSLDEYLRQQQQGGR